MMGNPMMGNPMMGNPMMMPQMGGSNSKYQLVNKDKKDFFF